MKKSLIISSLFLSILFFTGCSGKPYVMPPNYINGNENGYSVDVAKNKTLYKEEINKGIHKTEQQEKYKALDESLRTALKMIATKTIEVGKTNFVILTPDTNNLNGFPINTYKDLRDYCINYERGKNHINFSCSMLDNDFFNINIKHDYYYFKILSNEEDYTIMSFNAKDVLEELNTIQ
jgi:hypothetical protein